MASGRAGSHLGGFTERAEGELDGILNPDAALRCPAGDEIEDVAIDVKPV
jgi:hypothetical protein